MDYEKKDFRKLYEDLVKSDWFKRAYHDKSLGECPFDIPELADSEDERIRKFLVDYAIEMIAGLESDISLSTYDGIKGHDPDAEAELTQWQKARAYLEKQKEQLPYTDFVIKPHKGDDTNPYDMSVSEAQEYAIKRGFGVPFNDGEVYVDERHLTQTIGNILRWADEHPKEQKPAEWEDYKDKVNIPYCSSESEWSEDLKNELAKKHLDGYCMGREDTMREMMDFLKSHFNCEKAREGTYYKDYERNPEPIPTGIPYQSPQCGTDVTIVPNINSGTSTLKAEG